MDPSLIQAGTTRPVTTPQGIVRTPVEDLHAAVERARTSFFGAHFCNLTYLPPMARFVDGEVREGPDGESDLYLLARPLPSARGPSDPDPFALLPAPAESRRRRPRLEPTVLLDAASFRQAEQAGVLEGAPLPVRQEPRWALGPTTEWVVAIDVDWGHSAFHRGLARQIGAGRAGRFADWLAEAREASENPSLDQILTIRFDLPGGRPVCGHVILSVADLKPAATVLEALDAAGSLAELAGAEIDLTVIPELAAISFLYDSGRWRLCWYASLGDLVTVTRWLEEHGPDPRTLLGTWIPPFTVGHLPRAVMPFSREPEVAAGA